MISQPNLCRPPATQPKSTNGHKANMYKPTTSSTEPSALRMSTSAQARELVLRRAPPLSNISPHTDSGPHPSVRSGPPSLATSLVLSRLSNSPTLLPENVARLISAISMVARVSIRASGLFIECLLEACQLGTIGGLGLTRRMLITAVGSARTLQYVNKSLDWSGRDEDGSKTNDAFLQVLDKYTNLGIYLIHHTFTLAELFAMSGFYLTATTVQTGFAAAEESVKMLDSILGSNETSRALSSIITLVRAELSHDSRYSNAERSAIANLTSLTKAITAFVCLQTATHKRSLREMRLRVVYDCTIVVEGEATEVSIGDPGKYAPPTMTPTRPPIHHRRSNSRDTILLTDLRGEAQQKSRSRPASLYHGGGAESPMTRSRAPSGEVEVEHEIVEELRDLCGVEEGSGSEAEELPESVVQALSRVQQQNGHALNDHDLGFDYEIEVEETTTTTTTTIRTKDGILVQRPTVHRHRSEPSPQESATIEGEVFEEDEWVELSPRLGRQTAGPNDEEVELFDDVHDIPAARNGTSSLANLTRQDTIDHPQESNQRFQVVLRTMTKKFTQRRRTVRRLENHQSYASLSPPRVTALLRSPKKDRGRGGLWSSSSSSANRSSEALHDDTQTNSAVSTPGPSPAKGKRVLQAFSKALKRSPSSETQPSSLDASRNESPTSSVDDSMSSTRSATPAETAEIAFSAKQSFEGSPLAACEPMIGSQAVSTMPSRQSTVRASQTPGPRESATVKSTLPPRLRHHNSLQSMRSMMTTCTHTAATPTEEPEPKAANFPRQHLISNLDHFMRYSSAAYGQAFLRILGMGRHEFNFPTTSPNHHANNHAFSHHVGIHVDDVLLSSHSDPTGSSSFSDKMSPIVNFVAIDHKLSAVVLSCRGSLGLSDVLVDLTCDYEPISVEHGDPDGSYSVHSGMWASATILQRGTVHRTIREALEAFPTYGLVLCGHSLGGGVAALLSIVWASPVETFQRELAAMQLTTGKTLRHPPITTKFVTGFSSDLPPGRPIACYTYGVPCVASVDLARYCEGLVWSTVHNHDIVSTLSLGVLRDLKNMAMGLATEGGTSEEIVGRVIGLHQRKYMARRRAAKQAAKAEQTSLMEIPDEAKDVPLSVAEVENGRGTNKALDPAYKDPSLLGAEVTDDVELNDWLYSLVKTIRAGNDNEKLYPPGLVHVIESYTVFISSEVGNGRFSRREGRRILLRAVDDVQARFSEPVFGRTMASDHSPTGYENALGDLFRATVA